ncbi:alkaline shock response membrane anchor protein AmaP [Pseudonocardia phyllosphaerae]|uniref:alkaline shock response membrane anchor protein AmaP n=1 Tax=Pseudonocardia phyllosphaerae TaxID=3390502 RepID=UPI00397E8054
MPAPNPPARLNRTLLALSGLVLLLVGAAVLLLGTGLLAAVPGVPDPAAPLLPAPPDPPDWWPWLAVVAGVVVGLLALRWLLAQGRRKPRTSEWALPAEPVDGRDTGRTRMHSDRVADALAADVRSYDGVRRASAVLVGEQHRPRVQLDVTAEAAADLTALRARIAEHALPRLREAIGSEPGRTELLLRLATDDRRARVG